MTGKQVQDIGPVNAERFLNTISVILQEQINLLREQSIEKGMTKGNWLKNLPKGVIHKLWTTFDFLHGVPVIQDLIEKIGIDDPMLKEAILGSLEQPQDTWLVKM